MLLELKSVFLNDGEKKEFHYKLPISQIDIDGIFPFTSSAEVSATAVNRAGMVTLTLRVVYGYDRPCDRCGVMSGGVYTGLYEHRLVQQLADDGNDDYIETPDFTLELDDILLSDIILSYPQKFLCREDCKGLCQHCGKNLNEGDCGCEEKAIDPRLEILKQLMDESNI